ncbi:hypothetical protein ACHAWX_003888 [Stephanocyclus meneghinianus]
MSDLLIEALLKRSCTLSFRGLARWKKYCYKWILLQAFLGGSRS